MPTGKKSIEPFAHYFPVNTAMGNHESLNNIYYEPNLKQRIDVDKFPFATESSEYLYAKEFVNPNAIGYIYIHFGHSRA